MAASFVMACKHIKHIQLMEDVELQKSVSIFSQFANAEKVLSESKER